jgi:hypothetical protein
LPEVTAGEWRTPSSRRDDCASYLAEREPDEANPPTRRPARRKAAGSRVPLYAPAAAVVVVVAVLGVVVLTGDDDDSAPLVASDEPGVAHVHWL